MKGSKKSIELKPKTLKQQVSDIRRAQKQAQQQFAKQVLENLSTR